MKCKFGENGKGQALIVQKIGRDAKDCIVEDGEGHVTMESWDVMKASYTDLFAASPELHCTIVSRTVVGKYVLDEENVTGRRGNTGIGHVVAVYRVEEGLIRHVRFLR